MRLIDACATKRRVADTYFDTLIPCVNRALDDSPTVDAVPVVRCEKCVLHGNCVTEDAFVLAGIENPYCCAGKRKEGADNG